MRTFLIIKKEIVNEKKESYIAGVVNSRTYPSVEAAEPGVRIIEVPTPEKINEVAGCHIRL